MIFVDSHYAKEIYRPRKLESYKGDFGHTLILCGSLGMVGAGFFASMGAVKSGSGLTTLGSRSETFNIFSIKLNEVMLLNLDKINILDNLERFSSIVFGSGIGINKKNESLLRELLLKFPKPIVVDADGLTMLSRNNTLDFLKNRSYPTILTPHYGEFSRLTNLDIEYIKENRVVIAKEFASKYGCILLLKDHKTLITDGKNIFINTTGNSVMATGGMGDILSGIIGSFVSQQYLPIEATLLGAYIHGKSAEYFSDNFYCITPTNILEILPKIIKEIEF